jgi:Fur family ferric uptake transcriptional regulator
MPSGIQDSLREKGVRLTRQRRLLLDLIDNSGLHLDADTLYNMAQAKDPKLNRVTVYRTLKLLKESGLVDELDLAHFEGEKHYYETRLKQEHAHIICLRCGRVEELFGEQLQALRRQVQSQFGFEIVFARTEVGGYCSHCQVLRAQDELRERREAAARQGARH